MVDKKTILVIDDDELVLEVTASLLIDLGYQVLAAQSANAGFEIFIKEQAGIDLVLSDLVMPDLSGSELARKIRTLNKTVKILFSSGYREYDHPISLKELGVSGMISKPFTMDNLSTKVREVLDS